jgi:mRNA interferase MazF
MRRGSIVWINLEDTHPPEFGKTRPGIVISNTEQNTVLETVVVIPLSTRPPEMWPLRLQISLPLKKRGFAVIPGIRQVSKARLMDVIGTISTESMREIDRALRAYLAD